jgi:conjugative transfer region lipoprotein (TIGR03751 family)
MRTIAITALCASISLLASGCATTSKEAMLPQDGPTIQEIFDQHQLGVGAAQRSLRTREALHRPRPVQPDTADLAGYTREAADEIEARFPRLPNPTLVMFVYPHLAGPDAAPIPGYATSFPMYERVHYALPGEAP